MNKGNNINWVEIIDNFSRYDGRTIDFCNENNITPRLLYYHRKRLKKDSSETFHILEVPKASAFESLKSPEKSIRIEIGNAKIFLPVEDNNMLLSLVRELAKI